jgi:hypothetical protein
MDKIRNELTKQYEFLADSKKVNLLLKANETLKLNKTRHNKIVFVYTPPKVGSTSVVSSLRIFASHLFDIIHIHDEEMLKVLSHISDITVKELIIFNKYLGKDVYVIDIYRSPIERKISTFFENIGYYHFNNVENRVNQYNVDRVIHRFNNIFQYIANGDYFIDNYKLIETPPHFDWDNKYMLIEEHGIKYVKLRLKDSDIWGRILSHIFGIRVCIVKDYETNNKPIKQLFTLFKSHYKIPSNYLTDIMACPHLNYYYSPSELKQYYNEWSSKQTDPITGYTIEQYRLYEDITKENSEKRDVEEEHYMDEGCLCKACVIKRLEVSKKLCRGIAVKERINHKNAKSELIEKQEKEIYRLNNAINRIGIKNAKRKDFNGEMSSIVKGIGHV